MKKKIVILVVMAVVSVIADQASKIWAEQQLATVEHPIPLSVAKGDSVKTLDELVKRRFPALDASGRARLIAKDVRKLFRSKVDSKKSLRQSTHYFVFHRRTFSEAPRHLFLTYKSGLFVALSDWLDLPVDTTRKAIDTIDKPLTARKLLSTTIFELKEKHLDEVLTRYVFQLTVEHLKPETAVKAGDLFVVLTREVVVFDSWWVFVYAENPGSAWSFMAGMPSSFRAVFFVTVSLIALIVILVVFFRVPATETRVLSGFALIVGGAVGNLIDRVRFNYVIDFIRWHWNHKAYWPTFNIADVVIVIGVGLLIIDIIFNKQSVLAKREDKPDEAPHESTKRKKKR